ncbi:hypothetical protein OL233_04680 [Vagococcus sp. PNs007]|uniref:YcaO domain-containing protein n=1 Tax=Vagococcus proximus TaxID=2991417 RepID=A0ABT5X0Q2_9ENTE|nr:hypothetical protein [Vagococcus proximus]MDF0479579.1 hypothetical protein [Vagococcus proximus]
MDTEEINELLEDLMANSKVRNEQSVVNNLKLLLFKGQSNKLTVNVTPKLNYVGKYHGFHPSNSTKKIVEIFLGKPLRNREEFEICLKEYCEDVLGETKGFSLYEADAFMEHATSGTLEDKDEKLQKLEQVLFRQAILQVCTHFGYEIEVKKELVDQVTELIKGHPQLKLKKGKLLIPGIIIGLDDLFYDFSLNEAKLVKNKNEHFEYKGLKPKLLHGGVYYSGVMPSVKEIKEVDNSFFSDGIKALNLSVIQTTFATLDMFDNNEMIHHDLFAIEEQLLLKQFYFIEDQLQNNYLYQVHESDRLEKMNSYLKESLNSHTIAVSANVVTSDDYLILGRRSSSSIDSDSYYCSANGQSEFYDKNVKFYQQSVTEDTPYLEFSQDARNNFALEIEREVEAELGISDFEKSWEYYGISYLSIHNKEIHSLEESSKISKRRMHFNVLLHNK